MKINVLVISVILLLLATLVQAGGIVARNPPSACKAPGSKCACSEGDNVQNGCIKVLLNMGSTTPWTGSKPCALKVFSDDMSPQVFTPDSLYAVCGGSLNKVNAHSAD